MPSITPQFILGRLAQRLKQLEDVAVCVRTELQGRPEVGMQAIYLETLDSPLLRSIREWRDAVKQVLDVLALRPPLSSQELDKIDFVLGHASGLGRDFDMDISWSKSAKSLKQLITDTSMTALAAQFVLGGDEPPEITKKYFESVD